MPLRNKGSIEYEINPQINRIYIDLSESSISFSLIKVGESIFQKAIFNTLRRDLNKLKDPERVLLNYSRYFFQQSGVERDPNYYYVEFYQPHFLVYRFFYYCDVKIQYNKQRNRWALIQIEKK